MGGPRPVILQERENLKLTCAASGDPKPVEIFSFLSNLASTFLRFGIISFCRQVLLVTGGTDDHDNWRYSYLDTTELLLPG